MTQSIAGPDVDASYVRPIEAAGRAKHGDKFDASSLVPAFAPYWRPLVYRPTNGANVRTGRTFTVP